MRECTQNINMWVCDRILQSVKKYCSYVRNCFPRTIENEIKWKLITNIRLFSLIMYLYTCVQVMQLCYQYTKYSSRIVRESSMLIGRLTGCWRFDWFGGGRGRPESLYLLFALSLQLKGRVTEHVLGKNRSNRSGNHTISETTLLQEIDTYMLPLSNEKLNS